jgi:hypothetical protein
VDRKAKYASRASGLTRYGWGAMIIELAVHGTHGGVEAVRKMKWLEFIRAIDLHRARAEFQVKYNEGE